MSMEQMMGRGKCHGLRGQLRASVAVLFITQQRQVEVLQLRPQLMAAPAKRLALQQ